MSTVEVVKMHGLLDLSVAQLRFDTDVQCRASIDSGTVTEYKEALTANVVFPPLVVFYDGAVHWVADGFHRGSAYRESGAAKCPCDVRQGTKRDAILYAVGANTGHGLRRSNADKRRAVETLLKDAEWSGKSDEWIATKCGVSRPFVIGLRPTPMASGCNGYTLPETRVGLDGKNYPVKLKPAETKPVEKVEAKPAETWEPQDDDFCHAGPNREDFDNEEEDDEEDGEEATRIEHDARAAGEEPVPAAEVRKDLEADEASESIRNAKNAISKIWFNCPEPSRWRLKAGIENHLADLSE